MLDLKVGQLVLNPRYLGARGAHSPEQAEVELHYAEGEKQHLSIAPSALASSDHFIEQDFRTQGVFIAAWGSGERWRWRCHGELLLNISCGHAVGRESLLLLGCSIPSGAG